MSSSLSVHRAHGPACAQLSAACAVIGVGESAHFAVESNRLRAATLAHLVSEHAVDRLALEVGHDEAPAIDAWLRADVDEPLERVVGELTRHLYGAVLHDLRRLLPRERRPRVLGVDLPTSLTLEPTLAPLAALVGEIDPEGLDLVERARAVGSRVAGGSAAASALSRQRIDPREQDALTTALAVLAGRLDALAEARTDAADAWSRARLLTRTAIVTDLMLRAMGELFAGGGRSADTSLRERFVADRLLAAVGGAGTDAAGPIAYLAHNNHVQRTPVAFGGALVAHPAGQLLAARLGERYAAWGLTHLGATVPEMVVPAANDLGFTVEQVSAARPGAGSVEERARERGLDVVTDLDGVVAIRSQSAIADLAPGSFDAVLVTASATLEESVARRLAAPPADD